MSLHYVFGTTGVHSHVPSVIKLAMALADLDSELLISIIIHANSVHDAETLISQNPSSAKQIKLVPVGTETPTKATTSSYMDVAWNSGQGYAQILMASGKTCRQSLIFRMPNGRLLQSSFLTSRLPSTFKSRMLSKPSLPTSSHFVLWRISLIPQPV